MGGAAPTLQWLALIIREAECVGLAHLVIKEMAKLAPFWELVTSVTEDVILWLYVFQVAQAEWFNAFVAKDSQVNHKHRQSIEFEDFLNTRSMMHKKHLYKKRRGQIFAFF